MGVVMKDSYNLIDFIKIYYLDSNIPMYLFEGGNCIFCMPEQTNLTYPPEKYTAELLDTGITQFRIMIVRTLTAFSARFPVFP